MPPSRMGGSVRVVALLLAGGNASRARFDDRRRRSCIGRDVKSSLLAMGLCAALVSVATVSPARAQVPQFRPTSISVRHDGKVSGPSGDALAHFGPLGDPFAYIDWLCLESADDLGPSVSVDLRDVSVVGDGRVVGGFASASGDAHELRAYRLAGDAGPRAYCAHIRPRAYDVDTVRFVALADTHRLSRLQFAYRGDTRGCVAPRDGAATDCGSLSPAFGSFTYGGTATSFAYVALSRAASMNLGEQSAADVTRLRLSGFLPLLYIGAGSPTSLHLSAEAGFALPVTLSSTTTRGGRLLGFGFGPYWAQCLNLRTAVAPRVCAGVELDAVLEGVTTPSGAFDGLAPHVVASWFVSVGVGAY